jgi:micrococcal nuclease
MNAAHRLLACIFIPLALACGASVEAPDPLPTSTSEVVRPSTVSPTVSPSDPQPERVLANVVRVIDGDTINVEVAGQPFTLRYIGVDTPETKHPTKGVEPYGPEASERNRQLVEGKTVLLEKDVSETDRFGRLLRYVYVDDAMVNEVLVREGYARASIFPPDIRYVTRFKTLEREAIVAGRGLWSFADPPPLDPDSGGLETSPPPGDEERVGGCDPSYPDVCIPPPPPDLDCGDIQFRQFNVLQPDPHRFDGNKNGVGCEG